MESCIQQCAQNYYQYTVCSKGYDRVIGIIIKTHYFMSIYVVWNSCIYSFRFNVPQLRTFLMIQCIIVLILKTIIKQLRRRLFCYSFLNLLTQLFIFIFNDIYLKLCVDSSYSETYETVEQEDDFTSSLFLFNRERGTEFCRSRKIIKLVFIQGQVRLRHFLGRALRPHVLHLRPHQLPVSTHASHRYFFSGSSKLNSLRPGNPRGTRA